VKLPDAIIAATTKVHSLQLLTLDKKLAAKL
jgi:predicted nucleic acid-binding protein